MVSLLPKKNISVFIGFSSRGDKDFSNNVLTDLELVKADLLNQFMTPKGTRIMRPEYGTIVWDLLMEHNYDDLKPIIKKDILDIINREPRVQLVNYSIEEVEDGYGFTIGLQLKFLPFDVVDDLYITFTRSIRENKIS